MYSPVLSLPMLQRLALEAIVEKMERFLANYKLPPSKKAKTSESEQEKSRKYENEKRKRAFNPSWKTSFAWLEDHVMNDEGKMFCNICRRYDRSGSFSVGNMNFKLETIKGMMVMMGIFLTTILMMSCLETKKRKPTSC